MVYNDEYIYSLYEAESNLKDADFSLQLKYFNDCNIMKENALLLFTEGSNENVINYVNKVIESTQTVWNKFKENVVSDEDKKEIESYSKFYQSNFQMNVPNGFNIPNIVELDKLMAINIPSYTPEMNEDLSDMTKFATKYFSYLASEDTNKNAKTVAGEKIMKVANPNTKIDKRDIANYLKFINGYQAYMNRIEDSIKNMNTSANNIQNVLNSIQESAILLEIDENAPKQNNTATDTQKNKENDKFRDANSTDDGKNGTPAKLNISKITNTYFKTASTILSIKLTMCNDAKRNCLTILKQFAKLQGASNTSNAQPKEPTETKTAGQVHI